MSRFPLLESVVLCLLLLVLAWPLTAVTGKQKLENHSSFVREAEDQGNQEGIPFLIKLHGSEELSRVRISIDDQELTNTDQVHSSEWEYENDLALVEGKLSIIIEVGFRNAEQEEALKVEFWPEGLEEKIFTFWGSGEVFEELEIEWESYE